MAERCVALLRGINVGKAKRIAMADLRSVFERVGLAEVRTLLNSGNVVFTTTRFTATLPTRLRQAIHERLQVDCRVTILTAAELGEIIRKDPLGAVVDNPSRYLVGVLADPADRARLVPLTREEWTPERLVLGARVGYLWLPAGIIESRVAKALDRLLGDGITSRNWSTMLKLHALTTSAD